MKGNCLIQVIKSENAKSENCAQKIFKSWISKWEWMADGRTSPLPTMKFT